MRGKLNTSHFTVHYSLSTSLPSLTP